MAATQPSVRNGTATGTHPPVENFLDGRHDYETITDVIGRVVLTPRPPLVWFAVTGVAFILVNVLLMSITWLLLRGIGIWGNNIPVGWAFDIINFVWWIGIGHAGTLISAVLLLFRQQWRTSINRFAEAMTIFAVVCAGLYPLLHVGRQWVAYWLFPYPNILGMWPQMRSPLMWDVFAVSTYALVSIMFWYVGLVPDIATLRDRSRSPFAKFCYGVGSLGWVGSAKHWSRYETIYTILAGLSAPLVLSVHTIVSFDFATGLVPGWHTTIFPPYFVAGAVFAGFAMVITFGLPLRALFGLKDFITDVHMDWMAKILLATGLIVFYGYMMEMFYGWYSGNRYELYLVWNRLHGPYSPYYFALLFCNGLVPQLFWSKKMRYNPVVLFVVSQFVNVGMWLERFVIIPISLHRDFLPSSWGMYKPTFWDFAMFLGTMGLFTFLMFLFVKFLPMINIYEIRELYHKYSHSGLANGVSSHEDGIDGHGATVGTATVTTSKAGN